MIELSLFAAGIVAEVYEADFGVFRQEILDPTSALYEFRPQVLFLATSWRDLGGAPALHGDPSATGSLVDAEVDRWLAFWNTAYQRLGCQIIQNNFDTPAWRQLGNFELLHPTSLRRYGATVNQAFQDRAPPFRGGYGELKLAQDFHEQADAFCRDKNIPVLNIEDLVPDEGFFDSGHANYKGQKTMHPRLIEFALEQLYASGVLPRPAEKDREPLAPTGQK